MECRGRLKVARLDQSGGRRAVARSPGQRRGMRVPRRIGSAPASPGRAVPRPARPDHRCPGLRRAPDDGLRSVSRAASRSRRAVDPGIGPGRLGHHGVGRAGLVRGAGEDCVGVDRSSCVPPWIARTVARLQSLPNKQAPVTPIARVRRQRGPPGGDLLVVLATYRRPAFICFASSQRMIRSRNRRSSASATPSRLTSTRLMCSSWRSSTPIEPSALRSRE